MKFLLLTLLAILASTYADDNCENRAETCVDSLLSAILSESENDEICTELRTSVDCLKNVVADCLGDESDEEVEEGLQQLEKVLTEECGGSQKETDSDDEEDEISKCFEENEDYIFGCISEGSNKVLELVQRRENIDDDTITCAMYGITAGCFVERIGEKCGEEASSLAQKEMESLPEEIEEACKASGIFESIDIELLDKKK